MNSATDESEGATAGSAQSGAGSPDRHPLSLWIDRQRAAWFKRWMWVFLALLIIWILQAGLSIFILIGSATSIAAGTSFWWLQLPPATYIMVSAVSWVALIFNEVAINTSLSLFGSASASIPDDLEVALPVGETTSYIQSAFRRVVFWVMLFLQLIPEAVTALASLGSSMYMAFVVSPSLYPGAMQVDYPFLLRGLVRFGGSVALVIAILAALEMHAWLNLRMWGKFNWVRVVAPIAPSLLIFLLLRGILYLEIVIGQSMLSHRTLFRIVDYSVSGAVPIIASLLMYLWMRRLAAHAQRRRMQRGLL